MFLMTLFSGLTFDPPAFSGSNQGMQLALFLSFIPGPLPTVGSGGLWVGGAGRKVTVLKSGALVSGVQVFLSEA